MLCAIDPMARAELEAQDLAAFELLAQVLHDLRSTTPGPATPACATSCRSTPDLVKVDMALTRGADQDLARRTLLSALATFAAASAAAWSPKGWRPRPS